MQNAMWLIGVTLVLPRKKFLTPHSCRWLQGVPAHVYVRIELASDNFVPAPLDEEEAKALVDSLDPDTRSLTRADCSQVNL